MCRCDRASEEGTLLHAQTLPEQRLFISSPGPGEERQLVTRKGMRDGMRRCGPTVWSPSQMAQLSSASLSTWCILTSTLVRKGSTPIVITVHRCDERRANAILGRVCAMLPKPSGQESNCCPPLVYLHPPKQWRDVHRWSYQ